MKVNPTAARDIKIGDTIRLRDDLHSEVLDARFDQSNRIVGGPLNKTATAIKIETPAATILVHPGQLIGTVRR
jgi:hypothetical protein